MCHCEINKMWLFGTVDEAKFVLRLILTFWNPFSQNNGVPGEVLKEEKANVNRL